jgi:tetratricopeptide (TPR) repeat protein
MLANALLLLCLACPRLQAPEGKRESLQEFLARARAQRELVQARLRDQVQSLVKRVEELPMPVPRDQKEAWLAEVVALGPEATPLLVAWIDPGEAGLDRERFRATQIALALARLDTQPITGELLRIAQTGSQEGRRNAIRVLETTPEPERVRPALLALFKASEGSLKQATLRALITLGGADNEALLREVLESSDDTLIDMALGAVADAKSPKAVEQVRKLLADPARARTHVEPLLNYFKGQPELVREAEVRDLIQLAAQEEVTRERREAIVDALPIFVTAMSNDLRKSLEPLLAGNERKLREGALVLLSILGDKLAKRDLLKDYDTTVENNPKWSPAYTRRADVLRRVRDYDDAIKDYLKALKVGEDDPVQSPESFVGLARCYSLKKKWKEAASYLQRAPISITQLRALANDPDFLELKAHPKYGEVFPKE